ncbi:FunK1 protein kinase [Pochonia chlamydosporia 170]|uniref:non-specific serine/threonine protein kinase n=1 Tax=Pochonia chlamydosporia 170 TaxID=1380566 RepID=A0A179EW84_METCM|nr:FunK1 protein kinase [Pochonia chlamydosporia 170]OAQ57431.1 FunK1 protein kinase [Pochonia chlamydosporia 170]
MDQGEKEPVEESAIWNELNAFRTSFNSICKGRSIICNPDILGQLGDTDLRRLSLNLLVALQNLPAINAVPSRTGPGTVESDVLRLLSAVTADNFDFNRVKRLLKEALTDKPRDTLIWELVSSAAVESTPPPRAMPSSTQQTPWSQNTSSFVNSSESRQNVDPVLKQELEHLYVGLPNFHEAFFGDMPELDVVSEAVFRKCTEGDNPLFKEGWSGWPARAKESDVLTWIDGLILKLEVFAGDRISTSPARRKLLAQPRTPLEGSTGKRSMDIGFVDSEITYKPDTTDSRYRWAHILVAGELKSNPKADIPSIAWIDLARYAREVLAAQDTRRFVLGFTLCGPLMRVWEFDRLGGIASEQFDINKEEGGLQFVTTILGFLRMNEEMLGFDPTIITAGGQKYIEIERNGQPERLILGEVMKRAPCIAGRATTCWKAHRKDDPHTPLVIKDSWQYTDRDEEGDLIQEATEKGAINVARYYHHETVRVRHSDDEIRNNVRKRLDVTKATNYRSGRAMLPSSTSALSISRKGRSSSSGVKRPSSETDAALPPSKRSCSASPTKPNPDALSNRIHRRVILRDYGKPIYKASSRAALLAALVGCIEGHESLHKAGFLHRDISINNLMMNENKENPSWRAFLIDLDLAIREHRDGASGAMGKTGTRAFMAIGALLGEQHSFMHDLESFFWVLFWICIHYNGPDDSRPVQRFEKWNYAETAELAELKKGQVSHEQDFIRTTSEYFTTLYTPLIPWVNKLRKVVFPNGRRWEKEDNRLYLRMKDVLHDAITDPAAASPSVATTP